MSEVTLGDASHGGTMVRLGGFTFTVTTTTEPTDDGTGTRVTCAATAGMDRPIATAGESYKQGDVVLSWDDNGITRLSLGEARALHAALAAYLYGEGR